MMTNVGRRSLLLAIVAFAYIIAARTSAAAPATVTGEVVETYCWAVHQVGGTGHAQCGIECAKRGLPVALYDAKSRTAYILLPARDKASLPGRSDRGHGPARDDARRADDARRDSVPHRAIVAARAPLKTARSRALTVRAP